MNERDAHALTPHPLPHHAGPRASEGQHDTHITALAFSPDNATLTSASTAGTHDDLELWRNPTTDWRQP